MKISKLKCLKVLNSRGDWTIKTFLHCEDGSYGWAVVPEGASKGANEAVCVDPDMAIRNIAEKVSPLVLGKDFKSQKEFDEFLIKIDGTPDKSGLGGNTLLSLSIAFIRAFTRFYNLDIWGIVRHEFLHTSGEKPPDIFTNVNPTPLFNILNGGKHAHNHLSFQEFMVIPAKSYRISETLEIGRTVDKALKKRLEKEGLCTGVGDEGGFAPENLSARKALSYIRDAAGESYVLGKDVFLGMDVAADSFYKEGRYFIPEENLSLDPDGLLDYYFALLKEFEIIYLEDPFLETDRSSWNKATKTIGGKIMVSADDLVVTNPKLLTAAIEEKLANTVIVKPNQIGTLWETLEFVAKAKTAGWNIVVSHRSGDTEDPFIADLAYAVGADFVKFGAPARGERTSKYNRLLEIAL